MLLSVCPNSDLSEGVDNVRAFSRIQLGFHNVCTQIEETMPVNLFQPSIPISGMLQAKKKNPDKQAQSQLTVSS